MAGVAERGLETPSRFGGPPSALLRMALRTSLSRWERGGAAAFSLKRVEVPVACLLVWAVFIPLAKSI